MLVMKLQRALLEKLILRDKVLTEEEINIILDPVGMTTPGISGAELKHKK